MMDALKQRIREIQDAHKAIPGAAIAIAETLRSKVNSRRKGAAKANRELKAAFKKITGATLKINKRRGSGIPIVVKADGKSAIVQASGQVHHFADLQNESEQWMDIFADAVSLAAGGSA
jgi:hypothetical protein